MEGSYWFVPSSVSSDLHQDLIFPACFIQFLPFSDIGGWIGHCWDVSRKERKETKLQTTTIEPKKLDV